MTANGKNDIKRFKLVVVGDGACGKTSLLTVFKVCSTVILYETSDQPRQIRLQFSKTNLISNLSFLHDSG